MDHQTLLNVLEHSPWSLIVLLCQSDRHVTCETVEVIEDGAADVFVRGSPRPKVRWRSAGNARHARKGRYASLFVLLHQKACPDPQVIEEPVELAVQFMVLGDLPVGLLYVLDQFDNLAKDLVESSESIVGRRGRGQRGAQWEYVRCR